MTKVLFYLALIILTSCKIDRDKPVDRDKFSFKTADDTEIFFKNMRSSYYEKEDRKDTHWEIYRHEDLYTDTSGYAINVAIVVNVVQDEAYLLVEPGEKLQSLDEILIFWHEKEGRDQGKITLDVPNKETMREFASLLYEAMKDGKALKLRIGETIIPVFDDPVRKEAFRRTMADYYRLTRIF